MRIVKINEITVPRERFGEFRAALRIPSGAHVLAFGRGLVIIGPEQLEVSAGEPGLEDPTPELPPPSHVSTRQTSRSLPAVKLSTAEADRSGRLGSCGLSSSLSARMAEVDRS
jgi:hypothetical protein